MEKKSDETLSDYYKVFIAMCKRQAGVKLLEEERNLEGYIDEISEDHAKLVLDRLDLLSKLREISRHSKLDERIKLCENNLDTPDWWEPGKHDRELIRAVLKHGLYRSEQFILNDTEFSFFEAEKRYLRELEAHIQQMVKAEREEKEAELKKEMKEEAERLEKAKKIEEEEKMKENTPEKVEQESETSTEETPKETKDENIEEEKPTEVEKDEKSEEIIPEKPTETEKDTEEEKMEVDEPTPEKPVDDSKQDPEPEKMDTDESEQVPEKPKSPENVEEPEKIEEESETPEKTTEEETKSEEVVESSEKSEEEKSESTETGVKQVEEEKVDEVKPEEVEKEVEEKLETEAPQKEEEVEQKDVELIETPKEEESVKEETPEATETPVKEEKVKPLEEIPIKQATELKSRYPDLEVFQPLLKLKQLDSQLSDSKGSLKSFTNLLDTTMVVKWFRDFALEKRIGHIVYCIDNNEWPVGKSYSAYTGCLGIDLDAPLYETIKRIIPVDDNRRSAASTPDIITITTDKNITQQITEAAALRSSALSTQALNQSMAAVAAANSSGRGKGKKRHIAIDVETERAKLHALLNNTAGPGGQQSTDFKTPKRNMGKQSQAELLGLGSKSLWEQAEELNAMDMRSTRSTRSQQPNTQPPPAHQHQSSRSNVQNYNKSTVIPGTSSTLTPIDLSSR